MRKRKDTVWIVVDGKGRAYCDHRWSRRDMIAKHVSDSEYDSTGNEMPSFSATGEQGKEQAEAWKRRRKIGDRCVKAILSY